MNTFARQSFLGNHKKLADARIAVIGLGGGGSHVVQQLSFVGIGEILGIDPDCISETNLNRLVGAEAADLNSNAFKTAIAARNIERINPSTKFTPKNCPWQVSLDEIKICDLVIGCVDSYRDRFDLESFCRRYCVPYIDIGMDVHDFEGLPFISGQIICSVPGNPCMRCVGFFRKEKLNEEAKDYGAAGARPQVIWPNGVLASTAVGIAVGMLTGWSEHVHHCPYLVYDGNTGTVVVHPRWEHLENRETCMHFPLNEMGDALFIPL
ncbi:MAG: thiamine/molybdopterin biosynthesis protein [Acidobacteriales bacterium]|nr:thiamine/molybdopterin biosynthesis protein [Terriglobales bacterium]